MNDQDHHRRCAVQIDHALRCTCERERSSDTPQTAERCRVEPPKIQATGPSS